MAKRRTERPEKPFIDGFDCYESEYEKWKANPPARRLAGIFELPPSSFYNTPLRQQLALVGRSDYSPVEYTSDIDNAGVGKAPDSVGTAFVVPTQDWRKTIRPIIFLRQNVVHTSETKDKGTGSQVDAGIRLLMLMHELGHAEDMVRGVNFNHDTHTLDIVAAETYAHCYVCEHCMRRQYRIALSYYLGNLEEQQQSPHDSVRLSSMRALQTMNVQTLKEMASLENETVQSRIEKAGRWKEFIRSCNI